MEMGWHWLGTKQFLVLVWGVKFCGAPHCSRLARRKAFSVYCAKHEKRNTA